MKRKVIPISADDLSHTPAKIADIRRILQEEYEKKHLQPWIVAYSGGKDSTLLLQLVYEAVKATAPKNRRRHVYIVANDTQVESPLVIKHLKNSVTEIRRAIGKDNLPMSATITQPYSDQTFWVNVIGRGYIPPTRNFRWCTDRLKIDPTTEFIEGLTRTNKKTVMLVGTRKAESSSRHRRMENYKRIGRMSPHSQVPNCRIFSPLAELTDNEVWTILLQTRPPWGGTHRNLITLYKNAGGGECPLVLTKDDAPSCGTTSPRFGCWTCTVVAKDRSMGGLIDSGDYENLEQLYAFREWLVELRENDENRMPRRRNGVTKLREDGSLVRGPFTLKIRQKILKKLKALEQELGEELLSPIEERWINEIWHLDKMQYNCYDALMHPNGMPAVA